MRATCGGFTWRVEQPDGSFLNDRGLPDGNVYKIEGGNGDKKEQGLGQPVDSSDWNSFYADSNSTQTDAVVAGPTWTWTPTTACGPATGSVATSTSAIGYNHYFYHHPDGHWVPMPWDLDMMFIAETHQAGLHPRSRTRSTTRHSRSSSATGAASCST